MTLGPSHFVLLAPPESGLGDYRTLLSDMHMVGILITLEDLFELGAVAVNQLGHRSHLIPEYVNMVVRSLYDEFRYDESHEAVYEIMLTGIETVYCNLIELFWQLELIDKKLLIRGVDDTGVLVEVLE